MMAEKRYATRGMTLIEVLITVAILLIAAGLLFLMIIRTKMAMQASMSRSSARQDLQVTAWKIARELETTNGNLITDGSTGNLNACSFISAYGSDGQFVTDEKGQPLWKKYVIYYIDSRTSTLKCRELYRDFISDPGSVVPLTISELSAECNGQGRNVISPVTKLRVTPQPEKNACTLSIEKEAVNLNGRIDRQSREITVFLYNNERR